MSLTDAKQEAVNEFVELMNDMFTREQDARQEYAERFLTILEKWIKKSDIKYETGLVAGSNPVTGQFKGKLE